MRPTDDVTCRECGAKLTSHHKQNCPLRGGRAGRRWPAKVTSGDCGRACPDGGKCHHECGEGSCWRVGTCAPLTSYGERWSEKDKAENPPDRVTIEDVILRG